MTQGKRFELSEREKKYLIKKFDNLIPSERKKVLNMLVSTYWFYGNHSQLITDLKEKGVNIMDFEKEEYLILWKALNRYNEKLTQKEDFDENKVLAVNKLIDRVNKELV